MENHECRHDADHPNTCAICGKPRFGFSIPQTGAQLIAAERKRQITAEGWTEEHDDLHDDGQLWSAADCYLLWGGSKGGDVPPMWPWDREWWKPSDDRVRDLVKAGALIAAEIDRLQRQERSNG